MLTQAIEFPILIPMSPVSIAQGPLAGLVVVDFSRVLAGPYATALLADLGARVIKVEPRDGDDYRHVGPWLGSESALFATVNRGKESIVLDLKDPAGLAFALELCAHADVVVENFRPGVADKLGIGGEALTARNPRLIYASISGFGQSGPLRERPAYDIIVQALTGLMSINGDAAGPPTLVGESIGDVAAGLYGSWAILAALFQRERTGAGCRIDLAMFDALLAMMPLATTRYLATGKVPQRSGNNHALSAPFGAFRTGDGHVVVAVLNSKLFQKFAAVIGRMDLPQDERLATDSSRKVHEDLLRAAFEDWSTQRSTDEVVAALTAAGVPATRIQDVGEAVESEHARGRALFRAPVPGAPDLRVPEQPASFSTMTRGRPASAPKLDEHAAAIRAWIAKP
jgi:CoA:oxalate CoA-transferase